MSGETEKEVSGWTTDTLKEHLSAVIASNDRRYTERFDAQESASKYAQEKANEFRGSLDDVGKRQMPRVEAEQLIRSTTDRWSAQLGSVNEKVDALQARMDRNDGRSGGINAGWLILVAAVGLVATVIGIVVALRR